MSFHIANCRHVNFDLDISPSGFSCLQMDVLAPTSEKQIQAKSGPNYSVSQGIGAGINSKAGVEICNSTVLGGMKHKLCVSEQCNIFLRFDLDPPLFWLTRQTIINILGDSAVATRTVNHRRHTSASCVITKYNRTFTLLRQVPR